MGDNSTEISGRIRGPKQQKKKLCFVIGPIGSEDSDVRTHADWLLEEIIQPAMDAFPEYEVKRADQDHRPGLIDAQLINDLLNADLVIADLSGLNPNAFYEIGIRHMVATKPIIHMQLADEKIPFDVSLYRAIKFSRTRPKDIRAARVALKQQVEATHAERYQAENPVTRARGIVQLEEHATPAQQVILERLAALERRIAAPSSVERFMRDIYGTPLAFGMEFQSPQPEPEKVTITYFVTRKPTSPPQILSDLKKDLEKLLEANNFNASSGKNLHQMGIYSDAKHRRAIEAVLHSYSEFVTFNEVF